MVVIAPDVLRRQWQAELREKFFIDDFPQRDDRISAQETPQHGLITGIRTWWSSMKRTGSSGSMVPTQSPYRELAALAHSAPRLLLLSATPVTSHLTTYLGLLHLLDPGLYRWEDWQAFQRRFDVRKQLATAVFALDAEFERCCPTAIGDIASILPEDEQFRRLAAQVTALLSPTASWLDPAERRHAGGAGRGTPRPYCGDIPPAPPDDPTPAIQGTSPRRRSRTHCPSRSPDVRCQKRSCSIQPGYEAAQEALMHWRSVVANWRVIAVAKRKYRLTVTYWRSLVSRADGISADLEDALRWRLNGDERRRAPGWPPDEERDLLTVARHGGG